jgi:hypothetical protein
MVFCRSFTLCRNNWMLPASDRCESGSGATGHQVRAIGQHVFLRAFMLAIDPHGDRPGLLVRRERDGVAIAHRQAAGFGQGR